MLCRKCRKQLEEGWIACPFCGSKVVTNRSKTRRANGLGTAYKRGNTWTAKVVVGWKNVPNGKTLPVYATKGGFKSKTEALKYCPSLKENPLTPKSTDTLSSLFDRWQEFYAARIKPSTMACYKSAFAYYKPVMYKRIHDISVADLQTCIDKCPRGRSTRDDMRSICSLLYRYANQNAIYDGNPAKYLYCGDVKKGTREAFSKAELSKIKDACGVQPYAEYVLCLCYLGFRPGEMLALKKTAYDADNHCLIGGGKTKAGTDRIVTISPKIEHIIQRQMQTKGDYLFPRSNGEFMSDEHFRKYCFNPLMDALQITNRVPYSCRHTFANLMKNVQGSDTDKAALIGHADASMTKSYQSADYESLRAITDSI